MIAACRREWVDFLPALKGREEVNLPRLLSDEPLILRGYPLHLVLAEKLVTATDRGVADTRWRDVADIYLLSRHHPVDGDGSVLAVPRDAAAVDLDVAKGIGEPRWGAGRVTQQAGASGEIGLVGSALTRQVGNCEVHADHVPADGSLVDLRFGRAQGPDGGWGGRPQGVLESWTRCCSAAG